MLSLSTELKHSKLACYRWPMIIWRHAYRDFKLYYEQDDELHYFVIHAKSQQLTARIALVLTAFILLLFSVLMIHSVLSIWQFRHLEAEKIHAEKKRNEALSVLTQLSGETGTLSSNATPEQLLQMAQEYQQRVNRLEHMVQFSSQELARANRALEMGLKAAGLKPSDLKQMRLSMGHDAVASGGPVATIEPSSAQQEAYQDFQLNLQKGEQMNRLIKAFPRHEPVRFGFISSKFGARIHPITQKLSLHEGVDYSPTVDSNTYCTMMGRVISVGYSKEGYGNMVLIQHQYGVKTLYGHLNKIYVQQNQWVKLGQVIGKIGSSGFSTGRHLHYEILVNESKVNPSIMTAMANHVY